MKGQATRRGAPVVIRYAEHSDIDGLLELLALLFTLEPDFTFDAARQRRGLNLMLDGCLKHRCICVAQAEGRIVGMSTAQTLISTAEGGVVALVEDVVVRPDWQGKGLGRRLLAAIETWARSRGATRLQLLADRGNTGALQFYRRAGWDATRLVCLRRLLPGVSAFDRQEGAEGLI